MASDRSMALIRQLRPEGQAAAVWLINELRSAGLPAIVTSGRRTPQRQRQLIAAGLTTATRSLHLLGRAMDIGFANVPTAQVPPAWLTFAGSRWELIGGRWGGRFRDRDPIHFDF